MPPYEGNPNHFIHKFTVGKTYPLVEDVLDNEDPFVQLMPFAIIDDNNERVAFGKGLDFHKHFRFVSEPADFVWPMVNKTVEPKVGQVWECVNNVMPPYEGNPDYFSHKFTIGKRYKLKALTPYKYWHIDDDSGVDVGIDVDGRDTKSPIHLSKFFRFVSEPADKLKMQTNVDPAISFEGKATMISGAHSSVVVDPMKHENEGPTVDEFLAKVQPDFDLYSKLDDAGKKVMRENYPNVKWPKEKVYWSGFSLEEVVVLKHSLDDHQSILEVCNGWTPEVNEDNDGKFEIRFVKGV
jgi:hypothetical protein